MKRNTFGDFVDIEWLATGERRSYIKLDAHIVMPDHFHGIIWILNPEEAEESRAPTERPTTPNHSDRPEGRMGMTCHAPTPPTTPNHSDQPEGRTGMTRHAPTPPTTSNHSDRPQARTGMTRHAPTPPDPSAPTPLTPPPRKFAKPIAQSLPTIIGAFKAAATKRINNHRRTAGAPVWQRNYYERIIRNEEALQSIRRYIHENPSRWPARA